MKTNNKSLIDNPDELDLLNVQELSKLLKISEHTLRHSVMYRRIPFIKVGRLVRFDRSTIKTWLESNSIKVED